MSHLSEQSVVSHAVSRQPRAPGQGGPLEGVAREEHVPDEGLDGSLAHQSDEEELLYHRGGHGPEGGQSEQQLAEPGGLVGVLGPAVLLQRALRLLLQLLHHGRVCQTDRICKET